MSSYPYPPPLPPTHQAPRPSPLWWVAGGLCLAAGLLLGGYLLVALFVTMFRTEGTVIGDDGATLVEVEPGRSYLLWAEASGAVPACTVTDAVEERRLLVHSMGNTRMTRNDQTANGWFEADSSRVTVECTGPGSIEIGPRPDAPSWVGGLVGAILLPVLLGLAGIVLLVVTGVRLAVSPSRR